MYMFYLQVTTRFDPASAFRIFKFDFHAYNANELLGLFCISCGENSSIEIFCSWI